MRVELSFSCGADAWRATATPDSGMISGACWRFGVKSPSQGISLGSATLDWGTSPNGTTVSQCGVLAGA